MPKPIPSVVIITNDAREADCASRGLPSPKRCEIQMLAPCPKPSIPMSVKLMINVHAPTDAAASSEICDKISASAMVIIKYRKCSTAIGHEILKKLKPSELRYFAVLACANGAVGSKVSPRGL